MSVKILYGLAVYLFILEFFYPFDHSFLDSESYVTKALLFQTEYLSWLLEVMAIYIIFFIQAWQVTMTVLLPFIYFNSVLRAKLKDVRRRADELEPEANDDGKSSIIGAYALFIIFMFINGAVFHRPEGTPIIKGALRQYSSTMHKHFSFFFTVLSLLIVFFMTCCIIVVIKAYKRASPPNTPSSFQGQQTKDLEVGSDSTSDQTLTKLDMALFLLSVSYPINKLLGF